MNSEQGTVNSEWGMVNSGGGLSTREGGNLLRVRGGRGERGGWERTVGIFPRILRLGEEDLDEGLR